MTTATFDPWVLRKLNLSGNLKSFQEVVAEEASNNEDATKFRTIHKVWIYCEIRIVWQIKQKRVRESYRYDNDVMTHKDVWNVVAYSDCCRFALAEEEFSVKIPRISVCQGHPGILDENAALVECIKIIDGLLDVDEESFPSHSYLGERGTQSELLKAKRITRREAMKAKQPGDVVKGADGSVWEFQGTNERMRKIFQCIE